MAVIFDAIAGGGETTIAREWNSPGVVISPSNGWMGVWLDVETFPDQPPYRLYGWAYLEVFQSPQGRCPLSYLPILGQGYHLLYVPSEVRGHSNTFTIAFYPASPVAEYAVTVGRFRTG